jgi:hypothetical protein
MRAALVGMAWPVTAWLPSVRHPQLCGHHRHVLERARYMEQVRVVERLKNEGI